MWRVSSSGRHGLAMKPSAPAASARSRASPSTWPVSMRTGMCRVRGWPSAPDRVPAAQTGQRRVHQDEEGCSSCGQLQAAHRVRGARDAQPVELQVFRVHLARIVEVFDEQDERRCVLMWPGRLEIMTCSQRPISGRCSLRTLSQICLSMTDRPNRRQADPDSKRSRYPWSWSPRRP